ncbi:hypothetical protein EYF80_068306 [Liparis tanakae]|uniref:Uncharacterized protein n=1 Tax=Liparis tanakae TaxID=230148 RepID=A0A4Z2DYE7_9TELE|nr:hypothetical protein EYF80_068306 [Liparis tanakae]
MYILCKHAESLYQVKFLVCANLLTLVLILFQAYCPSSSSLDGFYYQATPSALKPSTTTGCPLSRWCLAATSSLMGSSVCTTCVWTHSSSASVSRLSVASSRD